MNDERPNIMDNNTIRPMTDEEWAQYTADVATMENAPGADDGNGGAV